MDNKKYWSDNYLTIPYVDGGRDLDGLDCWGLVRDVLHRHFSLPLLKSFGNIHADDKENMTRAYSEIKNAFSTCLPTVGTVAAGFNGDTLIHVGVVVESNGLKILHTSSKFGMCRSSVRHFNRLFSQVKYYEYK